MAPGGPKNLRQKRNVVAITGIKGILNKENSGVRGQHNTTTPQLKGGHPTIDNNPPNSVVATSQVPETPKQPIPSSESVPHVSSEDVAATIASASKRTRGKTTGKGILKYFTTFQKKMKIDVDTSIGRPKNANQSAKLASEIGVVTRDVLHVPKRWKDVDEVNGLGPGFDHLQIHMDVNIDAPGVKRCLVDRIRTSTRQKRHILHKHFCKFATLQEAKDNKPSSCDKANWEELCDMFATDKYKKISEVNRNNRQKLQCKHITGRKAFTVRHHEISEHELNGELCDRIDLYERTHSSEKDGWKSDQAKKNWEMMKQKREDYIELGIEKSAEDIVLEVLDHGAGYTKGFGYGPKPLSRRNKLDDSSNQITRGTK